MKSAEATVLTGSVRPGRGTSRKRELPGEWGFGGGRLGDRHRRGLVESAGLQRHPQFKDLPTLDESGFKGFDAQQWYGVVGPAGMPAPIVRQLNETLATVLRAPDLREKLSVEAIEPTVMTPEQFSAFIQRDIARWTALAKARNIHLDA